MGFSEVLLKSGEFGITDPDRKMEMLACIREKACRLETIVSDLLDLGRIQSGQSLSLKKAPLPVDRLLEKVLSQYRGGSGHRFEQILSEKPVEIEADGGKPEQVLEILLGNAVKFSPEGGLIRVTGRKEEALFRIAVEDEGIGMAPEAVEKILDKFYRVDSSDTATEGLGLGMSIAKAIVEAHGGDIEVKSTVGRGTSVSFTFPLPP